MSALAPTWTPTAIDAVIAALAFDERGLVPAIAQDEVSGAVLMLAWMNADAVRASLTEGRAVYWSRSRQSLWRKGETSGNMQALVDLRFDCDADAVLLIVRQTGPACHTGRPVCFFNAPRGDRIADLSA
ncbi:MAG: phosphoribosyl-AMP cyclohydrolase [Pseudomonadota bacterium]